jgi:hypothetical protein
MLNVNMLSVVMLNVMAPINLASSALNRVTGRLEKINCAIYMQNAGLCKLSNILRGPNVHKERERKRERERKKERKRERERERKRERKKERERERERKREKERKRERESKHALLGHCMH